MEKLLLLSLGFLLILHSGNALRCYRCRSHRKSDCENNGPLARADQCPSSSYNSVPFCMYKETYDTQLQAPTYTSDCGQVHQTSQASSLQSIIQQQHCQSSGKEQVRDCKICMSDLCNVGSNTQSNYNPGSGSYNPNSYNPNNPSSNYNPNSYNPNSYNPNNPNSYNPNNPNSNMYRPGSNYNPGNQNSNTYRPGNDPYNRNQYSQDGYRSADYNADGYRSGDYNADTHQSSSNYDPNRYRNNGY